MVDTHSYNKLKDSGIDWIGYIPESWNVRTLYQLVTQVKCKNSELKENNLLSLSYGKIKRKDINSNEGLLPASFDGYNIIEAGDIVLRLTDLQNDHTSLRVGLSTERGIITSAYTTLRPINSRHSKYIYYLLHTFDLKKGFYGMGSGVRQGLTYDEVKELRVVLPSDTEQEAITAYLDDQCGQIDSIIDEAKKSIDEYKAWKVSIIYEAVTKGLNREADFIESGIVWIGKIPSHWKTVSLKQVANIQTGGTPPKFEGNDNFSESGIPWIKPDNLGTHKPIEETAEYISESGSKYARVFEPNTVYVCCIGSIGKTGFSNIKCSCNQQINALEFQKNMYWKYGYYAILSQEEQHWFYANGNVLKILNTTNHGRIKIPLPPLTEQVKIASYLDAKCAQIEDIISEKQSLISDLESYKRSLIYEIVTGKRKVV